MATLMSTKMLLWVYHKKCILPVVFHIESVLVSKICLYHMLMMHTSIHVHVSEILIITEGEKRDQYMVHLMGYEAEP